MNALISDYRSPVYSQGQTQVETVTRQMSGNPTAPVAQTQPRISPQFSAPAAYQQPSAVAGTYSQQQPMSIESMQYLNGFLTSQIGSRIKVEFLVGTNTFLEKSGKLLEVGVNFIVLQEAMSDDLIVCDFFNIKFVTIYR